MASGGASICGEGHAGLVVSATRVCEVSDIVVGEGVCVGSDFANGSRERVYPRVLRSLPLVGCGVRVAEVGCFGVAGSVFVECEVVVDLHCDGSRSWAREEKQLIDIDAEGVGIALEVDLVAADGVEIEVDDTCQCGSDGDFGAEIESYKQSGAEDVGVACAVVACDVRRVDVEVVQA